MLPDIATIGVTAFGLSAILLVSFKKRIGFILGLCSQPFWFWIGWRSDEMGVFILAFAYTITWCIGIYNHYWREP